MRVMTVGTGTAAPSPSRVQSATLLHAGDVQLLVDCGGGAVARLAQLGLSWQTITHVALTHFHADHTNDLANLCYAWRYGLLPPRTAPLTLIGPVGTAALFDRLVAAFGESLRDAVPCTIVEVAPLAPLALAAGCTLEACKVPHTPESVAYSFAAGTRRVVVSGDTGFDAGVAEWALGSDLLLLECSLPDDLAIPTHLTPRLCGALAALAQPARLALTHFYPPVESVDIEQQVAEHFSGETIRAFDGWTLDLQETPCSS